MKHLIQAALLVFDKEAIYNDYIKCPDDEFCFESIVVELEQKINIVLPFW